jgi:integrase
MATAKKLPSGSWRCLAFSHKEPVYDGKGNPVIDPKTKKQKQKRIYESFTSDDPSPQGKREAEAAAALFQLNKSKHQKKKQQDYGNMTLTEAIDKYIDTRVALQRSPTTVEEYRSIQRVAFQDVMVTNLGDLDEVILQEAINVEASRPSKKWKNEEKRKPISAKTLKNEWGLIRAVLKKYRKGIDYEEFELPQVVPRMVELPPALSVLKMVKGTDIELPVLLAAWLSYSMSEVRGVSKSKSISPDGNFITINEVVVDVKGQPFRKELAKNPTRNRRHKIPTYIKELIDKVEGDILVPMSGHALYHRWIRLQNKYGMEHITFHDLRHLNASIMALLRIPDKYAQERGGWKSDAVMKKVYMQTFSEERERVDNVIDDYFMEQMETVQHEIQHKQKIP